MHTAALLLLLFAAAARAEVPSEWLVIEKVDQRGRRPFNPDRVFARYLLDPVGAPPPKDGDKVGDIAWQEVAVDEKGSVQGRYAYAYAALESPQERIVLARLQNGGRLYVNGDGFVGDIYGMRHSGVPIVLRKGTNHLFVRGMRGSFRLELKDVEEVVHVAERDATLPDLLAKGENSLWGAAVILNASRDTVSAVKLEIEGPGTSHGGDIKFTHIPPLGVRKLPFSLLAVEPEPGEHELEVAVSGGKARSFKLRAQEPGVARRHTFHSRIDGSLQEYSVLPPTGDPTQAGIVLTLHGAGVDAFNQVRSYSPKEDFWIVAPTNRRRFGFDWQDWGRIDAYEVLERALKVTAADPERVFLTGHSMGGHGVWHLAANDPDGFVAIAPSAGWCSFDTYAGGRPKDKLGALWRGADGSSLTLDLVANLVQVPTFILHGRKDDNVPLSEAERMEKALREAGAQPVVHYAEGKGHWWDGDAAKGVDCVDWPGIFDLFRKSRRVGDPDAIDFTTVDPGVDANHHWVWIEQPLAYGERSRVRAKRTKDSVAIETTNVRRFQVRLAARRYVIDQQTLDAPRNAWFFRDRDKWTVAEPVAGEKRPERSGPFKRAFNNRFVFVYGSGDAEGMKRARFDAQMWWYRGNGDVLVVSDREFSDAYDGRNVILYGFADGNQAFARVLSKRCPIQVQRGELTLGKRHYEGENLGAVFVYPRKDDPDALVGVFGHTGAAGARVGYTLLPFVSGVGYPDYALFSDAILAKGDEGVLAAGWFDHSWRLRPGVGELGK
ncbi:MAG: carboxylesterase family protein [Planctomycetota bacterium]|jgi:dienelactone hydrolase